MPNRIPSVYVGHGQGQHLNIEVANLGMRTTQSAAAATFVVLSDLADLQMLRMHQNPDEATGASTDFERDVIKRMETPGCEIPRVIFSLHKEDDYDRTEDEITPLLVSNAVVIALSEMSHLLFAANVSDMLAVRREGEIVPRSVSDIIKLAGRLQLCSIYYPDFMQKPTVRNAMLICYESA